MSFGSNIVIEVRSSGSDTNGGAFDPFATTMAGDLAATSGTGNSPIVTSASYTFVAGDVGAKLFIRAGTNWNKGWYSITSVSSGAATLNATIGTVVQYNSTSNFGQGYSTVAGIATVASPTSGTWSIDYSQQNSAQFTFTDMVIDATTNTKFTSAGNPVGPNFVGNFVNITSGTGFTVQRVQVNSVSGTVATCDKSLGTTSSTGGNSKLGGGMATPGGGSSIANSISGTNASIIYINYGTYTMTSSTNVASGAFSPGSGGGSASNILKVIGYDTNRHIYNSDTNRPTIQPAAANNSFTMFNCPQFSIVTNLILANANSCTGITGIKGGGTSIIYNCKVSDVAVGYFAQSSVFAGGTIFYYCEASNCPVGFNGNSGSGNVCLYCTAHGWTSGASNFGFDGFNLYAFCTAYSGGNVGFRVNAGSSAFNCIADSITSNSATGFTCQGPGLIANSIVSNNGSYGFDSGLPKDSLKFLNCATYNNGSVFNSSNISVSQFVSLITLTASPYTGSGNFAPNSTSGGGALLRAAGFPTTFLPSTTNYADVGAFQHQETSSSGPTHFVG